MNDGWLKIRMPSGDIEGLKQAAAKQEKGLSEYVRELLSGQEIIDTVVLDAAYGKPKNVPGDGKVSVRERRARTPKRVPGACEHAISPGHFCLKCSKTVEG
jgi:hypothetical protein